MKWTQEQREAIEYRGENILLAAAAGSGKTAVLVQRIIELIQNGDVSVNELLVLTFTEAAAGEMKEKIKKAIASALKQDPENQHLQKQRLLIHSSSISTVHSFCLNTLNSNIHLTDLPVDFSIISETENKIMLKEALDEVLERFYSKIDIDPSFADLVVGHGGIKNDSTLREIVLGLHDFSRSMAYPARWLNAAVRPYRQTAKQGEIAGDWWRSQLEKIVEEAKNEIFSAYELIDHEIENNLTYEHPYGAFFEDERENIKRVFGHMSTGEYSSVKAALDGFEFGRMKPGRRNAEEHIVRGQERVKALRESAKKNIAELKECFGLSEETVIERISLNYPVLRTLKNIVLMLDRCYTRKKRAKSFLDFNDLEHEALNLLVTKKGVTTEVGENLRKKYKYILVDEYQDTNNIQDLIFRTVARDDSNIFMVGDLKQSIYKFRNAVPKLFSDKYDLYDCEENSGHLIRLFKNFRSRRNVVDTVNFVFRCVMSRAVGDIDYTEEEYLVRGAEYPEVEDNGIYDTEFHMICQEAEPEDDAHAKDTFDKTELEAKVAAMRICDIVKGGMPVFDKDLGAVRPAKYRDIVVLMRNTKKTAPVFEKVFEDLGIPVYTEVGRSYLGALEVQTVLAFLQIIDNPRQDIPLIATLRSPMCRFDAESLANIREQKKDGCFFEALTFAAENGNDLAAEFLAELEALRQMAEWAGIDKLIHSIYYDCGYYAYVGSLDRGSERQANLRLLLERAAEFESTKMSGLFGFMNYIDTMREEGGDMTTAKAFGDGEDVVQIMSIHKSKGLEFPIVILADTAHKFNLTDASKSIIWDEQGGLGAEYADTRLRVRYSSLPKTLVGYQLKQDMVSEEMRLLYVALTRAREKLIITSTFKISEKAWKAPVWDADFNAAHGCVRGASAYREWLTTAVMSHPDGGILREYCDVPDTVINRDAGFGIKVFLYKNPYEIPEVLVGEKQAADKGIAESQDTAMEVQKRLEFEYPNQELGSMPIKLSVSEVKRMQAEDGEFVPLLEELKTSDMMGLNEIKGAERGTVVHFVMQMADPQKINTVDDVKTLVESLVVKKIISQQQGDAVDCKKVADFFAGPMGQRLKEAVRRENEFSFYTQASADEIYGNGSSATILLQGTMDCFFVERDGTVVLLDFKTDRVSKDGAAVVAQKRYATQMKYYKKALGEILEKPVDECYLYFLECGELVSM